MEITPSALQVEPHVYLKRRRIAYDYWLNVPKKKVSLSRYGTENLINIGLSQPCRAVGCVLGWLNTIPEFNEWRGKNIGILEQLCPWSVAGARKTYSHLRFWLGMSYGQANVTFAPAIKAVKMDISAWEEGRRRLEGLVEAAEEKVGHE